MTIFRVVRQFGPSFSPSTDRAYRVESQDIFTEKEAVAIMKFLNSDNDWTEKDNVSNSSEVFEDLINVVERLIRSEAYILINGNVRTTARLIVAQLAHEYGMVPTSKTFTAFDGNNA